MLVIVSCNKDSSSDCFKKNGNESRELRLLGAFKSILVNQNINVHLYQGNEFKVEVIGPHNLIPKIKTTIHDTTLVIENDNRCNFVRGYKRKIQVFITVPKISYCEHNSVGTFVIDQSFSQEILSVRCGNSGDMYVNGNYNKILASSHGNGNVILNGECDDFAVYSNGENFIYAENLIVKGYAFVGTNSLGDVYVNGSNLKQLDCAIHSKGNVYYTGNPLVNNTTTDIIGSGKIIHKN